MYDEEQDAELIDDSSEHPLVDQEAVAPASRQPPGYFRASRGLNSLILVAPLFLFYQIGILTTEGWKNGADFVTQRLFEAVGRSTPTYLLVNFGVLVFILTVWLIRRGHKRPSPWTWLFVVVESTLYAAILGGLVIKILRELNIDPPGVSMSAVDNLVMSLGAGAYEELVFRGILLTALLWLFNGLKLRRGTRLLSAVIVSSLIFSAFHYVPFGIEAWQAWSFSFRAVAGALFALIFLLRGFAVAAYTHTIYDIIVLVL